MLNTKHSLPLFVRTGLGFCFETSAAKEMDIKIKLEKIHIQYVTGVQDVVSLIFD